MKVKVIRQFLHPHDQRRIVQEGETIEVSDLVAQDLERNKLVVPEVGGAVRGRAARSGDADPTDTRLSGGPTGEDKPASSSDRDLARPDRVSTRRAARRGA